MAVRTLAQLKSSLNALLQTGTPVRSADHKTFLVDVLDSMGLNVDIPDTFTLTVSTADASGGSNGDVHLQYSGSDLVSIWHRASGSWNEYSIPSGGGTTFSPTKANIYDAVKGILVHNSAVTADDADNELDITAGGSTTIPDNSIVPAKAQAGNSAQQQAWRTRLGAAGAGDVPEVWSTIANGTQISLGKVVIHGGAYFGCITQHAKGSTGPDGDPTNWILLSNWRGDWAAAWYPAGSLVRRAGLPWVATAVVSRNDPAPDASTNTKWLRLGSSSTAVVVASSNTSIPASANGNTYLHTGSSNITYTLPAASGGSAVDDGWEIVISNQGSGDLTIDGAGADTIDGNATLVISDLGRSVKLQKVANGAWISIADTKDEVGTGGGSTFSPTKANIYDAVKGILVHNAAVTADDANDELDIDASGAATDQTARNAAAAAQRTATSAQTAATAAQRTADGKQDTLTTAQRLGLLQFDVIPGVVVGYTTAGQAADWLTDWRIWVSGGDTVGDVWMAMSIEGLSTLAAPAPTAPGASLARHKLSATNVYNFTFANANRQNLVDGRVSRRQGRDIEIDITFYDAASGGNTLDIVTVSVDWVAAIGLNQSQVDARARAVAGPVIIVSNIASYDATQNRFEDSGGNEVTVPNGAIVTLTQAVYDAAVTDAGFTPNANAIFLTR